MHDLNRTPGAKRSRRRTGPQSARLPRRPYHQIVERIGEDRALLLTLACGAVIAVLATLAAAGVYDSVTEKDGVAGLDRPALTLAISIRNPTIDSVGAALAYIFGTIGLPLIAVTAIVLLSLRRRTWTPAILLGSAGVGSLLMTIAGKSIVGRVRPPHVDAIAPFESSPSFPSGHALNSVVILGMIAYLLILGTRSAIGSILVGVAAAVVAIGVGLSRVLIGAHWFTDVLASWALGAGWLAIIVTVHQLHRRHHRLLRAEKPTSQKQ